MDWFRWWHGTVSDPKLRWVARKSGVPLACVIATWAALLEAASNIAGGDTGVTRGDVAGFDCDAHDAMLDVQDGTCARIIAAFAEKGMVKDGRIANWGKRQTKRQDDGNPETGAKSAAQRKREQRERERERDARGPSAVTQGHEASRNVTQFHDREDKSREDKTEGSNSLTAASDVGGATAAGASETVSGNASVVLAAPAATTAGLLSRAFRERGVQCTPSHPDLVALVNQGVSLETAIAAADHARISKPDGQLPLRYVTRILEDWAKRPTVNAAGAEAPAAKGGGAWWRSDETALAKAMEVGAGPARAHESRTEWHARIQAAIDNGGKPPAPAQAPRQADPITVPQDDRTGPSDASRSAMGSISSLLKTKVIGGGIPA